MQSEPTEVQPNEPAEPLASQVNTAAQHGLQHDLEPSSSSPSQGDAVKDVLQQSPDNDAVSASSGGSGRGRRLDHRRLKRQDRSSPQGSPGSHIDQYEKLHLSASTRDAGMSFQVIPSATSLQDKEDRISIDQFPNEILTHIVSHLPPSALSAMSLVSRRFHNIITTPHAWRIAFSRLFPGQDGADKTTDDAKAGVTRQLSTRSERRFFARLTALASWRSEYILRTRLLRSLARGKPAPFPNIGRSDSSRHANAAQAAAVVTYSSNLVYLVTNIHATFGYGFNRKIPSFMHGASEYGVVTVSDPSTAKVADTWGANTDYSAFRHFEDSAFAGEAMWGLGAGDLAGVPNTLDLSHGYGRIYGEGLPGGRVFFTPVLDRRGVFLTPDSPPNHDLGIPDINAHWRSVCCTWIVKSERILKATTGIFGLLAGYSNGTLAAYALGTSPIYELRFGKGEPTATWVLSPGVPIIAVQVDEQISSRRLGQGRLWVAALNALGEVFYLTEVPSRPEIQGKLHAYEVNPLAWKTGRSVHWKLIESSRRLSRPDPFNEAEIDGSYSPRSSSDAMGLTSSQTNAETKEIEQFLSYKPNHFQKICDGWDMRRRLLVDFAGDDHSGAGESIVVLTRGLDEDRPATIRRFMRHKLRMSRSNDLEQYPMILPGVTTASASTSGNESIIITAPLYHTAKSRSPSHDSHSGKSCHVEWRLSDYTFGGLKAIQISAEASDDSQFAVITASEDPLLGMSGGSNTSSPFESPLVNMPQPSTVSEIPGQRARFMAVGTATGAVLLWNMRAASPSEQDVVGSIPPLRVIHTESPQISCLALTSLYLVHGGNDGLVQAWDPLLSSKWPVRTLNSRFSSRARRRLIQAEASVGGIGNNYYAAGAVVLDPDPTVLRGMVSLGTHLRYWSYSSSEADQYKGSKRRLRGRSERGSNAATHGQRFTHTGRAVLNDYIAQEKNELEREQVLRRKEHEWMSGRFGTDLLGPGASEEEMLAYAAILSEESYTSDEVKRRGSGEDTSTVSSGSTDTVHEGGIPLPEDAILSSPSVSVSGIEEQDRDIVEAIRLSLEEAIQKRSQASPPAAPVPDIPIRYSKKTTSNSPSHASSAASSSRHHRHQSPSTIAEEDAVDDDLSFALSLSLAEEQGAGEGETVELNDEYPILGSPATPPSSASGASVGKRNKGKGRM